MTATHQNHGTCPPNFAPAGMPQGPRVTVQRMGYFLFLDAPTWSTTSALNARFHDLHRRSHPSVEHTQTLFLEVML